MGGSHPGSAPAVSVFFLSGAHRDGTVSGRDGDPAQTASGDLFARHLSEETRTAAGWSDSRRVGTALAVNGFARRGGLRSSVVWTYVIRAPWAHRSEEVRDLRWASNGSSGPSRMSISARSATL